MLVDKLLHQPCRYRIYVTQLARRFLDNLVTSSRVGPSNPLSSETDFVCIVGGGAPAVVARIRSTLPVK